MPTQGTDDEIPPHITAQLSDAELTALKNRDGWTKGVVMFHDEAGNRNRRTRAWAHTAAGDADGAEVYGLDEDSGLHGMFAYYTRENLADDDFVDAAWVFSTLDASW